MENYLKVLQSDCEELLGQFQRTDSVRYENFVPMWRKLDFPSIFYGKMLLNEMRMFCRLALITACRYFLPPYTFQIRVGGLYLLYGLYHAQLASPKEKIRIALKDWDEVMKFQQDAVNAQHYDVVYILRKLLLEKSFYFTAMPALLKYQTNKNFKKNEVCEEFRERPERVKDLISVDTLEEILNVHQHYEKIKASISAVPGQIDSGINLIRKDLVSELRSTALEYDKLQEQRLRGKNVESEDRDGDPAAGESSSDQLESSRRAELLASIKSKSYGHVLEASRSRRHRQVEKDTSGSGTEAVYSQKKKRPLSLSARTKKNLIEKGGIKHEAASQGLTEETSKGKRKKKRRFQW